MNNEDIKHRIKLLKDRHYHLHATVEALIAEKAPETSIKRAKIEKLKLKDEMNELQVLVDKVNVV